MTEHGKWNYVIHNAGITKSALDADFDRVNHVHLLNLIDALRGSGIQSPQRTGRNRCLVQRPRLDMI